MATKAIKAPANDCDELAVVIPKARKDKDAAERVIQISRENGTLREVIEAFGIHNSAERSIIKHYAGDDELLNALCAEQLSMMSGELAGPNPTPLEKLLCDRIAFCWFHLQRCEAVVAQQNGLTFAESEFYQKKIDRAHKRYLAAIKALAQVRKLQLPNVQVNIGEKQVNIGEVKAA